MISNDILSLLNTAPTIHDPEDDQHEHTVAKIVDKDADTHSDTDATPTTSKIRQKNISFLDNDDERYKGKTSSRKSFEKSANIDISVNEDDDYHSDISVDSALSVHNESTNESHESASPNASADEQSDQEPAESDQESGSNFQKLLRDNPVQNQKGQCVKNQLIMWENLLEMRIKLQKCLLNANKMPSFDYFNELKGVANDEFDSTQKLVENNIKTLLDNLLHLQTTLWSNFPETGQLTGDSKRQAQVSDDEEIPSDTESESEAAKPQQVDIQGTTKKKRKLGEYDAIITDNHKKYKPYRNSVINKWNEKTKVVMSKNLLNNTSVVDQIEYILRDREKTLKRTQLNRSNVDMIRKNSQIKSNSTSAEREGEGDSSQFQYDPEIFDDTDFYHQLLRELIEYKSSDITDPIKLSRQWVQLQSMRNKIKRAIDTRATKGRKIKYVVHNKMVNFMAPIDNGTWSEEATTELFKSLFRNH